MEAVIFIGIQAIGKSTFYKKRFFRTHVRINLDMLRTRRREQLLLEACLKGKQRFVVDNTNITAVKRAKYISLAKAAGFTVVGYYFQSQLKEALRRNEARPQDEQVPPKAIVGMYKKLELPSLTEGFDALYYVKIEEPEGFVVQEWANEL